MNYLFRLFLAVIFAVALCGCADTNYTPPNYAFQNRINGFIHQSVCNNQWSTDKGYLIEGNCYNKP